MMSWFLGSRIGRWLIAAGAIVLAIVGIRVDARRDAKRDMQARQAQDRIRRTDAGRAAAMKAGRDLRTGKTPQQIVDENSEERQ